MRFHFHFHHSQTYPHLAPHPHHIWHHIRHNHHQIRATPTSTPTPTTTHPIFKPEAPVLVGLVVVAARNFMVDSPAMVGLGVFSAPFMISLTVLSSLRSMLCASSRMIGWPCWKPRAIFRLERFSRRPSSLPLPLGVTRRWYNADKICQMGWICQSLGLLGIAQHATLLMPLFGKKFDKAWRRRLTCKCPEDCCQC